MADSRYTTANISNDWTNLQTLNGAVYDSNWKPSMLLSTHCTAASCTPKLIVMATAPTNVNSYINPYNISKPNAKLTARHYRRTMHLRLNLSKMRPKAREPKISPKPRPSMQSKAFDVFSSLSHSVLSFSIVSFIILMKTLEKMPIFIAVESMRGYNMAMRELATNLHVSLMSCFTLL